MNAHNPALARFGGVSVRLSVELGRTEMPLRDVLSLGEGSVVSLERMTDELLDVTANGRVIARGEVIAEDGRFALRIVSLAGEDGEEMSSFAATGEAGEAAPGGAMAGGGLAGGGLTGGQMPGGPTPGEGFAPTDPGPNPGPGAEPGA